MDPSPSQSDPDPPSLVRDDPQATGLSQNAAAMWQHYQTTQAYEANLAMGQPTSKYPTESTNEADTQPRVEDGIPEHTENNAKNGKVAKQLSEFGTPTEVEKESDKSGHSNAASSEVLVVHAVEGGDDGEGTGRHGRSVSETETESESGSTADAETEKVKESVAEVQEADGSPEREPRGGDQETRRLSGDDVMRARTEDISIAVAALVPLPFSPSRDSSPVSSSPTSSRYMTPASTPSRSPSPPPHSSFQNNFPDGHHDDEPIDSHSVLDRHPITKNDAETQTDTAPFANAHSQTDAPIVREFHEASTNTLSAETGEAGVQTEKVGRREVGCNTELKIAPELVERAKLSEQLSLIQSKHAAEMVELNEARSQRMVAEELARIVQSELAELRQTNIAEITTRMRLEAQLGELQVELSSMQRMLEDKGQRVTELEETLTGTSLLVRKLEEQNAATLMNRGGIDYMLQAKLADARAREAEQKLEVAQVELLQSQGEVTRLLDRVGETTRDRSEMVSHKVHSQLLQIADERALASEHKARELEREVLSLRDQLRESGSGTDGHLPGSLSQPSLSLSSYSRPSSYTTSLGGYPSLSSTLPPYPSSLPPLSTSTLPAYPSSLPPLSSAPSLEPFKLSFSLPSASATTSVSATSADYSDSSFNRDDGASDALLKPSSVLGRQTATQKHVIWEDSSSITTTTTSSLLSGQHKPAASTNGHAAFKLPTFEPTTSSEPLPPPTDITKITTTTTAEGDKDSSSDWSSSDEEDEAGTGNPLRPSSHLALKAQWEWRAMAEGESEKPVVPVATGHTPKKKPPPTAPKPRVSWAHSSSLDPHTQLEDPSSFLEPARVSGLKPLSSSFRRPLGPHGRKLPSRFSKYMYIQRQEFL